MRRKPKQSPQRARKDEADATYEIEGAKRMARAGGICERCRIRPATQRHHVLRRSARVDHSATNLRVLCLWCHEWIHLNVADAKIQGWLRTEWSQIGDDDT